MSLIDKIKIKSLSEAQEILKAAGSEDIFEKAHKDGDLHPNGKWVWVSSAAGGKGDWRTLNGRTHKKHQAANATGGSGLAANGGSGQTNVKSKDNTNKNADSGENLDSETSTTKKVKSDFDKTAIEQSLKKNNGKLVGVKEKDGVIAINVKFADYFDVKDFEKQNKQWRATTNTGNNYEFVLLNKKGIESTTAKKTSTKKTTSGNSLKSKLDDIKRAISKNGYTANVSTDGSIVIYEKGARKTAENIKGRIKSFDDIDWGNKKGVQAKLESAIKAALEVGIVKKQASKGVSEKTLSDALIKECSKDIEQSRKEVIDYGYSSFNREINFNGKKQTIYVKLYRKDNIGRNKSYEISVGTEFGNIKKISEPTYIGSNDIKAAIKSYFSEKVNSIHIVDMQQSVRDKNSLLKQLKSSKSNKVLIHYHSTSGFDINKMRSIAEKEGWKITDKSVDKNGNHTYNVNSYIMFEKQTKK